MYEHFCVQIMTYRYSLFHSSHIKKSSKNTASMSPIESEFGKIKVACG